LGQKVDLDGIDACESPFLPSFFPLFMFAALNSAAVTDGMIPAMVITSNNDSCARQP
jgi:hypothetical protein